MSTIRTPNAAARTLLGRLSECPTKWKHRFDLLPAASARQIAVLECWIRDGVVEVDGNARYEHTRSYRLKDPAMANTKLAEGNRRQRVMRLVREHDAASDEFAAAQAGIARAISSLQELACAYPDGDDRDERGAVHGTVNTARAAINAYESADWRLRSAQEGLRTEIATHGALPADIAPAASPAGNGDPLAGDA